MSEKVKRTGRRDFLKTALLGSGAALVAAASGGADAAPTVDEPVAAPAATQKGYHVTAHIRDYYRTAEF